VVSPSSGSFYGLTSTCFSPINGVGHRRAPLPKFVRGTAKLWISDYGYDEALVGFQGCLRRLGLDYVDLFLLHQPVPTDFGATVAAYNAIEKMLSEGRARAIGVSNFSEQHLENLMERTEVVPAVNQVELHPFFTQPALRTFHAKHGITPEAWSPLGGIHVYRPADPDAVLNALGQPTVTAVAEKHDKTPAQVVLRWHVENGIVAIPKSVKSHRIEENIDVFDFELTADEVAAIDALDTGVRGGPDPETLNTTTDPKKVEN
jgi:2,5-diketo-D-gluconate reductase A